MANQAAAPYECNWGLAPVNSGRVFVVDPLLDERWRGLVERHPASSIFHSTEWLSALRSAYGYEPVVYTDCDPSAELTSGILFCKVKSWVTGRRLVSLPFSDHCDALVGNVAELDGLLLPVRKLVDRGEWEYCEMRSVRFAPGADTGLGESDRYRWHAIDLRPGIDEVFRNLHHSVRRKIRRAEREGLICEEGASERLMEQFYKLVVATRRRQHLPPQPRNWFRSLITNLGGKLKISVASKNGAPVASILTLHQKKIVTYKYGCSDARMHPLGGVAMLFWNTIQKAKAAGYESLDLGRSESGNAGLNAFKEHLGGIGCDLSYWRYPNRPGSSQTQRQRMLVDGIVQVAPDWVLTAVGSLCYRHIG